MVFDWQGKTLRGNDPRRVPGWDGQGCGGFRPGNAPPPPPTPPTQIIQRRKRSEMQAEYEMVWPTAQNQNHSTELPSPSPPHPSPHAVQAGLKTSYSLWVRSTDCDCHSIHCYWHSTAVVVLLYSRSCV